MRPSSIVSALSKAVVDTTPGTSVRRIKSVGVGMGVSSDVTTGTTGSGGGLEITGGSPAALNPSLPPLFPLVTAAVPSPAWLLRSSPSDAIIGINNAAESCEMGSTFEAQHPSAQEARHLVVVEGADEDTDGAVGGSAVGGRTKRLRSSVSRPIRTV